MPADLRGRIGRGEVVRSLGRCDQRTARSLCRRLSGAWEQLIAIFRMKQSLTRPQIEELVRQWLHPTLDAQDLEISGFKPESKEQLETLIQRAEDAAEGARLFAFKTRSIGIARYDVIPLLASAGVTDPDEDTVNRFCDLYLRAQVEVYEFAVARLKGEVWRGVKDPVFEERSAPPAVALPAAVHQMSMTPAVPVRTVEELSSEYMEREIAVTTGTKNVQKATAHLRTFAEIVGPGRPVSSLTRNDLSDFRGVLEHLPANVSKLFPNQPLRNVAAANHKKPVLSGTSINQTLTRVGAFLTWCRDHGHIEVDLSTTRLKVRKSSRAKESRTPFRREELEALFTGPLYSGCKSRARRNEPGDMVMRDGTYFLPLLGLVTGARLGELLGLTPEDIQGEAGRRVIRIRPNALRELKNVGSERMVPLHTVLEDLGFGEFLKRRTALKHSIFGDQAKVRGGNITNNASRWFSHHLDVIGIKRTGLSFHSFRHLFEDIARASDIPEDLRRALLGHTQGGMGAVYGGADEGFTLDQRRKAIESLQFPISLAPLRNLSSQFGKRLVAG